MIRRRVFTVAAILLGAAALGWLLLEKESPRTVADLPASTSPVPATPTELPIRAEAQSSASPVASDPAAQNPVDVDTRAAFNERAHEFFADAAQMSAKDRLHEAQQLEQELTRLEQAGGMSAGETLLVRAGLIRETVPAGAEQEAQLRELQERYRAETQRRIAATQSRPDPQFDSYKVVESQIVNEVMAMETIPDGLSRDEYLRRRLQSAREQLTPQ